MTIREATAMSTVREPCIHCGTFILSDHGVTLRTVAQLSKHSPANYAEVISKLENIPLEVAQEFVDHKMGLRCDRTEPPCPVCSSPLKTWHATGCWSCGWRRHPRS